MEDTKLRFTLATPPSEDNAAAAYQTVAESRAASTISREFEALMNGGEVKPAAAGSGGAPASTGNADFDALMSGGATPPAAAVDQGAITGMRPFKAGERRNNSDGSFSTEITTTWQDANGGWVNAPSLWKKPDGSNFQFSPDDEEGIMNALSEWEAMSGETLPRFKSVDEAVSAAKARSEAGGASGEDPMKSGVLEAIKAVGSDVGGGIVEAPRQGFGGMVDAISEFSQFVGDIMPAVELWDAQGNFSPDLMTQGDFLKRNAANQEEEIFKAISPDKADTVTGTFVRSTAQFLTGFLPGMQAMKGVQAVKGGAMMAGMGAGVIADMVVFDPNEDRLSTYLNTVPALASIVPDYLANNDPDQSPWEGRLKNAIEGAGLGLATDGLLTAFRYYKASRAAKAQAAATENPVGATVEAAKDQLKAAARTEIVPEIPDEALRPLGDAAPDAPLLIQAPANETLADAATRLGAARERALKSDKDLAALDQINALREKFAKGAPEGRDPMDNMLDQLRSNSVTNAKIPRRPVADVVKSLGGIDPTSSLAAELRGRGVTPQKFPGLFKNGGRQSLDNIPASEHEIFTGRGQLDPNGYLDQQTFVDGLEAELKGEPWMTPDNQKRFDDVISPLDDLHEQLDRLGINYNEMSNERVKQRIQEIRDAEDIAARDMGQGVPSTGRTLADIEKEARDQAIAQNRDPDLAAADALKPKIYINHARMNTADDVRAVIQEMADMDAAAITDKTRGVVTNEQTIRESSAEYKDLNDLIGRAPGPMTAAQATAARRLLTSSGEQIVQLAKIAQSPGATPADLYNFRRAMAVHYALQSEVVAARTETARALQAWSIPVSATKARGQAIADLIAQQGGAGDLQQLAKAVATVGDNPTALNTMARELGRGRFGAAVYQVWINGLLSSPKTHMVNILSNAMVSLYSIPERYMAAGFSKAFYNGEIEAGEATAQAFGLVKGIRDGIRLVYMGNKAEGMEGLSDVFDAFVKTDIPHTNAISADAFGMKPEGSLGYGIDMLGKIVNAPGSALNAEDKFFKTIGYRMELNALAYRTAAQEGLEGKEAAERIADILLNPPDNLRAEAMDVAAYQTFTNNLSPGARQTLGGIQKTPYLGPVFRLVVPFVKTPTNILKWSFARTPLAYMSGAIQSDIKAGGPRAAQAHARVALGTMVMLSVMDMAAEGKITGAGVLGSDSNETQKLRATARGLGAAPPYSIKIGDRWYNYSRTDPIAMIMGFGADLASMMANADDQEAETSVAAGIIALSSNLASKTYMSGIFDFMAAIDDSNPTSDPGKYLQNFAGGLVPYSSFLRNMNSAYDPTARESKTVVYGDDDKIDPVATYLQSLVNNMKRGIPGLSDELPARRDLFGEPISNASGIGWAYDFLSPVASRADNPDPITKEILDNRVEISQPSRNIGGVQLNAQEYDEYSALAGRMTKENLEKLINAPGFDRMSPGPDGMKANLIKDIVTSSRDAARDMMLMNNPALRDRSMTIKSNALKSLTAQ